MSRSLRVPQRPLHPPTLEDREFLALSRLIHTDTGIHLAPEKRSLVAGRLGKRLRQLGVRSYADYLALALHDRGERQRLIDVITTNETRFFREPSHFSFIARLCATFREGAAAGRRSTTVKAWSAACSTGEEPYSLAMTLRRNLPEPNWKIEIVAHDVSSRVLDTARRAEYPLSRLSEIPPEMLRPFMLRGVGPREGTIKVAPEIRALVRFFHGNLIHGVPLDERFDLILCRNVLIYFDLPTKRAVVNRLLDRLAPGAVLITGRSESLHGISNRVRSIEPAVYALLTDPLAPPPATPGHS
jgi:chemotaxis protein methyltransferase CheR